MRAIAARSHATFVRHPWAMQAMSGSRGGPNGMRHFEQSLAAVASLAIDGRAKLELIAIVDDYVFGYVFRTAEVAASFAEMASEEVIAELMPYFEAQLATGEFPQIQTLFGVDDTRRTWELIVETMTGARFETGLDLLLDGIEAKLVRDGVALAGRIRRARRHALEELVRLGGAGRPRQPVGELVRRRGCRSRGCARRSPRRRRRCAAARRPGRAAPSTRRPSRRRACRRCRR